MMNARGCKTAPVFGRAGRVECSATRSTFWLPPLSLTSLIVCMTKTGVCAASQAPPSNTPSLEPRASCAAYCRRDPQTAHNSPDSTGSPSLWGEGCSLHPHQMTPAAASAAPPIPDPPACCQSQCHPSADGQLRSARAHSLLPCPAAWSAGQGSAGAACPRSPCPPHLAAALWSAAAPPRQLPAAGAAGCCPGSTSWPPLCAYPALCGRCVLPGHHLSSAWSAGPSCSRSAVCAGQPRPGCTSNTC